MVSPPPALCLVPLNASKLHKSTEVLLTVHSCRQHTQCARIRAHIKMVEQALSELVNITATAQ